MSTITQLETSWVKIPLGAGRGGSGATELDLLHVQMADDEGWSGTGFTYSLTGGAEAIHALMTETLRKQVIGCDTSEWPMRYESISFNFRRLGLGIGLAALSAVDIAMWDLRSIRAGLPLYRFIGAHRHEVGIYGSGRSTHAMTTDELIRGTQTYVDEGYSAVKLRIGARSAQEDVDRVAAVRRAVGDNVRLMVDCNERLDLPTALWSSSKLADLGVYWMEEPLRSDDIAGHAKLAGSTPIPIAVGEHLHGRFEFANYLHAGAASVLQPDVPLVGGVTEWLRISAIAEVFGATLSPHFLPELHVHLAAAVPNCPTVEHFPLIDDVLEATLEVVDGIVKPPASPGHGIQWNIDRLREFRVR